MAAPVVQVYRVLIPRHPLYELDEEDETNDDGSDASVSSGSAAEVDEDGQVEVGCGAAACLSTHCGLRSRGA